MAEEMNGDGPTVLELTSLVVANYVANNDVPNADLPGLIRSVHAALSGSATTAEPVVAAQPPAISIRKSITPDALISLEDGRPYKMLKRHLTKLGLTPAQYRAKWSLPADYPMTAPNYGAARSALAKEMGLGNRGRGAPVPAKATPTAAMVKAVRKPKSA